MLRKTRRLTPPGPVAGIRTLPATYVNTVGLLFAMMGAVMVILVYMIRWGHNPVMTFLYSNTDGGNLFTNPSFWLSCFELLLLSTIIYMVTHVIGFIIVGARSRDIKFTIIWKELNPVISCNKALSLYAYRFALLLPVMILGVLPVVVSILLGLEWLLLFGALILVASAGDVMVLLLTARLQPSTRVLDHPTQPGFIVLP
jgi:hypothetical protein